MASGIFFDANGNDGTMEVLTAAIEKEDAEERERWARRDRKMRAEGWDAAVAAMVNEDGTPVEVIISINPYKD